MLTAIATVFGLSVVTFLIVARSAPVLKDDGTFETAAQQRVSASRTPIL